MEIRAWTRGKDKQYHWQRPLIWCLAANGDSFPMRVTLLKFHACMIDREIKKLGHIHPHALQKFFGLLRGDFASPNVFFIEGIDVLIHAALGNNRTGFLLKALEHLRKPLTLHCFAEIGSWISRPAIANFRNVQKLVFAR